MKKAAALLAVALVVAFVATRGSSPRVPVPAPRVEARARPVLPRPVAPVAPVAQAPVDAAPRVAAERAYAASLRPLRSDAEVAPYLLAAEELGLEEEPMATVVALLRAAHVRARLGAPPAPLESQLRAALGPELGTALLDAAARRVALRR